VGEPPAEAAAAECARRLSATLDRQRARPLATASRGGTIAAATRWLLTIGAVIWFPIVQPVLESSCRTGRGKVLRHSALLIVQLLSAAYLLRSAAFLRSGPVICCHRWDTQRRIMRMLRRCARGGRKWRGARSA